MAPTETTERNQMDKETFVKACASCGYCSRMIAREYAGDREEFTNADFEEAYRYAEERARSHHNARKYSK